MCDDGERRYLPITRGRLLLAPPICRHVGCGADGELCSLINDTQICSSWLHAEITSHIVMLVTQYLHYE